MPTDRQSNRSIKYPRPSPWGGGGGGCVCKSFAHENFITHFDWVDPGRSESDDWGGGSVWVNENNLYNRNHKHYLDYMHLLSVKVANLTYKVTSICSNF